MIRFDQLEYASLTDVGIRRSHNQDSHACIPAKDQEQLEAVGHLFVVADGMGAHAVGEKASELAVRVIPHVYQKHAREGGVAALRKAMLEANSSIHACGQENREFEGMGTTGSTLVLRPEGAWIAHVGDSRVYRIRDGWMEQLTFDHSLVWEYARLKRIDPADVVDIPSNVIHRCLGPEANVQVDLEGPHPLCAGDIFLMCSDGLSGQLSDVEIAAVASVLPPDEACRLLVDLANLRGGPDNTTVIIVRVTGGPPSTGQPPPPAAPRRPRVRIPWWLPTLLLGAVLAGMAAYMAATQVPGGVLTFLLAGATILAGLIGLWSQYRQELERQGLEEDPPRPRIHRRTACRIDLPLVDRLARAVRALKQRAEERHWEPDWDAHRLHLGQAEKLLQDGDFQGSFAEYSRAMLPLSRALDKSRHKEEVFKPVWDKT